MLTAQISGILFLLALAGLSIVALILRARTGDRHLEAIKIKRLSLHRRILELRIKVANSAPDNMKAHALLVEAAMMLVYPRTNEDIYLAKLPPFKKIIRRLDRGFNTLARVESLLDGVEVESADEISFGAYGRRVELFQSILSVSRLVAVTCPANEKAHMHLIKASRRLVFAFDDSLMYLLRDSHQAVIANYDRGLIHVARARAMTEACD